MHLVWGTEIHQDVTSLAGSGGGNRLSHIIHSFRCMRTIENTYQTIVTLEIIENTYQTITFIQSLPWKSEGCKNRRWIGCSWRLYRQSINFGQQGRWHGLVRISIEWSTRSKSHIIKDLNNYSKSSSHVTGKALLLHLQQLEDKRALKSNYTVFAWGSVTRPLWNRLLVYFCSLGPNSRERTREKKEKQGLHVFFPFYEQSWGTPTTLWMIDDRHLLTKHMVQIHHGYTDLLYAVVEDSMIIPWAFEYLLVGNMGIVIQAIDLIDPIIDRLCTKNLPAAASATLRKAEKRVRIQCGWSQILIATFGGTRSIQGDDHQISRPVSRVPGHRPTC